MKLEKIITIANKATKVEFLAMERSLRSTGCELPILVIPYDEDTFSLPDGSSWWRCEELIPALKGSHPCFRKYQCFLTSQYQFVDTDCIFLSNPEVALSPFEGFIVCCGHWRDATHAVTEDTKRRLESRTTLWQRSIFNSGQFACDRVLWNSNHLIARIHGDRALLSSQHHEQPAVNLLVIEVEVPIVNLTLPPYYFESSWAGDYPAEFETYWKRDEIRPYLMHWAGIGIQGTRPIDDLFLRYLSSEERAVILPEKRGLFGRWR